MLNLPPQKTLTNFKRHNMSNKSNQILFAIYNDKPLLKELSKSVEQYIASGHSLSQTKQDMKEIENYVKEKFSLTPSLFKQIIKFTQSEDSLANEEIEKLSVLEDIAKELNSVNSTNTVA